MSDPDDCNDGAPPRRSRGMFGCGSALLIVFGVLLLLPGICASDFVRAGLSNPLASAGLVVSGVGVAMIGAGIVVGIAWIIQAGRTRR
jgi:hypothetical protein